MRNIISKKTVNLTKENLKMLEELRVKLGENYNQVLIRALQYLYARYEEKK